ncbi:hypothetical protein P7L78_26465 [Tistrella bauzanensis]|uniref:peptidase n=1 Tax=Tistrella TaxID=171436 RepID=UPI0031F6F1AE
MHSIEIMRAGSHTPHTGGGPLTYTAADLADIAAAYTPAISAAPLVIGHPRTNDPAWGWVRGLRVDGDRLIADIHDVDPAFAELVAAGRYRTRSVSLYAPDSPANPTPGRWYLRHVGWLGATPPAIKGLAQVAFAGGGEDCVEFAGDAQAQARSQGVARTLRRLREWLRTADQIISADEAAPAAAAADFADPSDREGDMPDVQPAAAAQTAAAEERLRAIEAREAQIAAREAAAIQAERDAAARLRSQRIADDKAAVAAAVEAGRLPQSLAPRAEAVFAELAAADGAVEFAEGGAVVQATARQALRDLIMRLPLPVETRELADPATAPGPSFGEATDPRDVAEMIRAEIAAATAQGRSLSHADAVANLRRRGGV